MKKLISILTAVALTLSLTVTAFAMTVDQDSNPQTGSTAVTLNVAPGYTVTIPATVELTAQGNDPETYENDLDITAAANVRILEGKVIIVTITSDFTMKDTDTGSELPYTVTVGGNTISDGGTVATFTTSDTVQTSTLVFSADDPEYAGEYSDTVTFTISITDAPTS